MAWLGAQKGFCVIWPVWEASAALRTGSRVSAWLPSPGAGDVQAGAKLLGLICHTWSHSGKGTEVSPECGAVSLCWPAQNMQGGAFVVSFVNCCFLLCDWEGTGKGMHGRGMWRREWGCTRWDREGDAQGEDGEEDAGKGKGRVHRRGQGGRCREGDREGDAQEGVGEDSWCCCREALCSLWQAAWY